MSESKHVGVDSASAEDVVTVSAVVGEGEQARRLVRVGPWELTTWIAVGDDEPRIRDIDLGRRLGYERPRDVRKLVERLVRDGKLNDVHHRATVARTPGQVVARPATEYWLTEAQALKVAAKSETEPADALLDEMIAVYTLARHGLLPQQAPVSVEGLAAALAPYVDQSVVNATAPLAVRIGEQMRELATLRHMVEQQGAAIAASLAQHSSVLLSIAAQTKKMHDYMSEQAGSISGLQADRLKTDITWLAQAWVALGRANKDSVRSARREILNELFAGRWGGAGQKLTGMPSTMFPAVRARLDAMRAKAERALVRRSKPRPAPKKQGSLFDTN